MLAKIGNRFRRAQSTGYVRDTVILYGHVTKTNKYFPVRTPILAEGHKHNGVATRSLLTVQTVLYVIAAFC